MPAATVRCHPQKRSQPGGRARLDATPAQIALAWLLDLAPNVLLIPSTRTRSSSATDRLRVATPGQRGRVIEFAQVGAA
jgi:hypothetical protein